MNEVRNILVGLDFGEQVSQICYYDRSAEEPVSVPVRAGTGEFTFPNCLSWKPGTEEWHFGLEAEYFAGQQGECYVEHLFALCSAKEEITVGQETRDAGGLLGIFLRGALGLLGVPDPARSVSALTITAPRLTRTLVENVRRACRYLGFPRNRCFLQDYEESFYYYSLGQKQELWSRQVGLFTFEEDEAAFSRLVFNRNVRPVRVHVERGKRVVLRREAQARDLDFAGLIESSLGKEIYSSLYLVGDGFDQSWAKRSTALLCQHQRRVFYGGNLYAKGACCASREKTEERNLKGYLYMGDALVRIRVEMDMIVRGVPSSYPLAGAGGNWYEAAGECELLLDGREDLQFLVTDQETGEKERYSMVLPGLPKRPPKATRLRVRVEFKAAARFRIEVSDLGCGDLYPSSGLVWTEEWSRRDDGERRLRSDRDGMRRDAPRKGRE